MSINFEMVSVFRAFLVVGWLRCRRMRYIRRQKEAKTFMKSNLDSNFLVLYLAFQLRSFDEFFTVSASLTLLITIGFVK